MEGWAHDDKHPKSEPCRRHGARRNFANATANMSLPLPPDPLSLSIALLSTFNFELFNFVSGAAARERAASSRSSSRLGSGRAGGGGGGAGPLLALASCRYPLPVGPRRPATSDGWHKPQRARGPCMRPLPPNSTVPNNPDLPRCLPMMPLCAAGVCDVCGHSAHSVVQCSLSYIIL